MKTFHLWGTAGKPSFVSPESVALFWWLNSDESELNAIDEDEDVEIVFSNNTALSPNGHLPLLIISEGDMGEIKVSGFDNIVRYFQDSSSSSLDDNSQLYENALLEFVISDICPLTMYQLFLNKKNYTTFTRKLFSKLLYWPMWYNVPLNIRASVRDDCDNRLKLGYIMHEDDPEYKSDDEAPDGSDLAQSKVFKLSAKNLMRNKTELQEAKHNLQYLNKISEVVKEWYTVRYEELSKDKIIVADILFWANIFIQIDLPEGSKVLERLETDLGQEIISELKDKIDHYNKLNTELKERYPVFKEQGNVIMYLFHKGTSYF